MINIDAGGEIPELLIRSEQLRDRGRLDVTVPFFDTDSRLWGLLVSAARAGSRVRLMSRPPVDALQSEHFADLVDLGVRLVQLPRVHAKLVLLSDCGGRHSMGWIGSHNFTKASENTAQELGVVFRGSGAVETRLLQQALIQMDAWSRDAKVARKSR